MLYRSERNTGCRFYEVIWNGMRTLIMENQLLHITVVIDHGADIIEFNYKRTDTDFVWRNPMGISGMKKLQYASIDSDSFLDNYLGGFFEILPSIGGGGTYKGIPIPNSYSESNQMPWEYEVICDTEECVTLRFFVRLNKLPLELSRSMTLHTNSPVLLMKETVTNIGFEPVDFQWGWHPNIGGGFLNGDCVIDMRGGKMHAIRNTSRMTSNAVGSWPIIHEPDATPDTGVDFSRILPPDTMLDELVDVEIPEDGGWAAVRDTKKGIGIGLSWDPKVFSHSAVWESCCHKEGHFRIGGAYVMCFLLRTNRIWGLAESAAKGESRILRGKENLTTHMTFSVFEDHRQVTRVHADGTIQF